MRALQQSGYPLLDEVGRNGVHLHAQQVFYLRGEDGDGNTAGESDDDGIGDVLDDGAQSENTQQDEKDASHEGGNGESLHTILLNDAIDDDDEGTRGTAYLNLTSSEERNHESCHNGSDDALLRTYTAGNTEGDGQR